MNEVGFNAEYMKLKMRSDMLKERLANQIELFTMLVKGKGPCVKSRYMMFVGRLELKMVELRVELMRLNRRRALVQAALNRGEAPDRAAIEKRLEDELRGFLERIKVRAREVDEASRLFACRPLTEEETTSVRAAYLEAVKRLHPDVNPDLPEAARELWEQMQVAYSNRDWEAVRLLAALAEDVSSGGSPLAPSTDPMAAMSEACERLERRSRELAAEIARVQGEFPLCMEGFLKDEKAVAARQRSLKTWIGRLKRKIEEFKEALGDV